MAADVGIFQTMQDFVRWKQQGALMLFKPDGFDKIDPAFKDEDGAFTTVSVNLVTYAYNTKDVSAADVPKSALDFLKPMFAGQAHHHRSERRRCRPHGVQRHRRQIRLGLHGQIHGAKAALHPRRPRRGVERGRGRRRAGDLRFDLDHAAADRGRQADPDGAVAGRSDAGVPGLRRDLCKDAPHPNAAKLFLDWYLAPEQQRRNGAFSARSDVPPPQGFQPLSAYNLDSSFRALHSDAVKLAALKRRFAGYVNRQ